LLQDCAGRPRRLQGLAEYRHIEGAARVVLKIGVGIALDDRETMPNAGIDAGLAELDAAAVDTQFVDEVFEKCAIAAADIEHAYARRDHLRNERQGPAGAAAFGGGAAEDWGRRSFQASMRRRAGEEAAQRLGELRFVEEEGVMTFVALDLNEAHIRSSGIEAMARSRGSPRSGTASRW
jgi:hypothetical protein